jgi:hypothetical protein
VPVPCWSSSYQSPRVCSGDAVRYVLAGALSTPGQVSSWAARQIRASRRLSELSSQPWPRRSFRAGRLRWLASRPVSLLTTVPPEPAFTAARRPTGEVVQAFELGAFGDLEAVAVHRSYVVNARVGPGPHGQAAGLVELLSFQSVDC